MSLNFIQCCTAVIRPPTTQWRDANLISRSKLTEKGGKKAKLFVCIALLNTCFIRKLDVALKVRPNTHGFFVRLIFVHKSKTCTDKTRKNTQMWGICHIFKGNLSSTLSLWVIFSVKNCKLDNYQPLREPCKLYDRHEQASI